MSKPEPTVGICPGPCDDGNLREHDECWDCPICWGTGERVGPRTSALIKRLYEQGLKAEFEVQRLRGVVGTE